MYCSRCGYMNRPQARFCAQCRTPLAAPSYPPPQPPYTPPYQPPAYTPPPAPPAERRRPIWLWIVAVGVVIVALLVLCLGCGCLAVAFGPKVLKWLATPTGTPRPPSPTAPSVTPRSPTSTPPVVTTALATSTSTPTPRPPTPAPPTPTRTPSPTPTKPPAPVGLNIGNTAPGFTLKDLDGKTVNLSDYRGRPVLLNFWATWCGPCRGEMADLQVVYEAHKDQGFTVLAVDLEENANVVRSFMQSRGLTFLALLDSDGQVGHRYKVEAIPTSFFLDRDGVIRDKQIGSMNRSRIEAGLAKIL